MNAVLITWKNHQNDSFFLLSIFIAFLAFILAAWQRSCKVSYFALGSRGKQWQQHSLIHLDILSLSEEEQN